MLPSFSFYSFKYPFIYVTKINKNKTKQNNQKISIMIVKIKKIILKPTNTTAPRMKEMITG